MTSTTRPALTVPKVLQGLAERSQQMLAEARACGREAPVEPEIASESEPELLTRLRREYRARMGKPAAPDKPPQAASAASSAEPDPRLKRILQNAGLRGPHRS